MTKKKSPTSKKPLDSSPPEKLVDLARIEVEKAKQKAKPENHKSKSAKTRTPKKTKSGSDTNVPTKTQCDVKGCDYAGGSKSVVTRHWNKVHRKPHAQKRNARKRNQDQGRPTVLTPAVIDKLVHAFEHGYTKTQAFRYSGISKDAYYSAIKSDGEFADKMRRAQDHLGMKARDVVAAAINGSDVKTSKWWLERKAKDEYSLRREATGAGGGAVKVDVNKPKTISLEELHDAVLGDT